MNVKDHYEQHLGNFYSWMIGDFEEVSKVQQVFFERRGIIPSFSKVAIDLGAGNGIQSLPLARMGFQVIAVDITKQLLSELEVRKGEYPIEVIQGDMREVQLYKNRKPELIVCCGDTISHLSSKEEIRTLFKDAFEVLSSGGKMVLSFRDYSVELKGNDRFIPVRSDETRILICMLEYEEERVIVTDLLLEKEAGKWVQKISSYPKLRITERYIYDEAKQAGFAPTSELYNRMIYMVLVKP